MRSLISVGFALALVGTAQAAPVLRVCANPDNLPFSNAKGEGFENALAELVARDLGESVQYTWTDEHEHFVRKTLNAGKCDVLMGVPAGFDEVDTTQPYYTSGYVFVWRKDRRLDLSSIKDPRLRKLTIGLHVVGDDNTPPMEALARQGIVNNVVGYMIYRDAQVKSHSRLMDDVATGKLDVAAVWGPLGGYYAQHSEVPLAVVPITDTASFAPVVFRYPMAIGVRKGDTALRQRLNAEITREMPRIHALLQRYGVPVLEPGAHAAG